MHDMRIAIRQHAQLPPLPSNPALLVPAKEGHRRRLLPAVDEDAACLQAHAEFLGVGNVFAPNAGAQAGVCVVGAVDDFVFVGPGLAGDDGAWRRRVSA